MNEKNNGNCIPKERKMLEKIANSSIGEYGFKHEEKENGDLEETYRTDIRRQRDKILYAGGFRRLQDKTQVMSATLTGDHRTRLTHTLEVEQISMSIADALNLNKDLVSAIALGHDVGHTPFGHAAERALNKILKNNGGFHHPIQSVKYLWEKHGEGLISEIYEGILAHDSDMFTIKKDDVIKQIDIKKYHLKDSEDHLGLEKLLNKVEGFLNKVPSTLEAQVVIWADKIAYITHDLEDFLHSPIYTSVIKSEGQKIEDELSDILRKLIGKDIDKISEFESRDLIRGITTNLIVKSADNINRITDLKRENVQKETEKRLEENKLKSILQENESKMKKMYLNSLIINFEDSFRESYYLLREFLDEKYIFSSQVQRSDAKAQKIVSSLFEEFTKNYKLLPLEIRIKIDEQLQYIAEKIISEYNITGKEERKIVNKKLKDLEKIIELKLEYFGNYNRIKEEIIKRTVATYISTMSDTYAEDMFFNLNTSKDNYNL